MALLLHISDLHLRDRTRAATALGQMTDDLSLELEIEKLDMVVVSGDSNDHATPEQYEASRHFVAGLCEEFHVAPEQLLVVPGNHDVDWAVSKRLYTPVRTENAPKPTVSQYQRPDNKDYVEVVTDEGGYKDRFRNFADYHRTVTQREYPLDYEEQFDVLRTIDESVIVLGLNSAWNLDHYHTQRSEIHPAALEKGRKAVRDVAAKDAVKVVVWHHPLRGDAALPDTSFLPRLVVNGFVVGLHGHVHRPELDDFIYERSAEGRRAYIVGAGTLDAPDVTRGYPYQYNLLAIEDGGIELRSRRREDRDGAWFADARFGVGRGKPPTDRFTLSLGADGRTPAVLESTEAPPAQDHKAPIKELDGVTQHLREQGLDATGYRIAVEALIFDLNGRLLLQERGRAARDEVGMLEGVGGTAFGDDLIECVEHHVRKEIGEAVRVEVDELLEVRPTRFLEHDEPADWVVISYLCRLMDGEPEIVDDTKTAALRWVRLTELHALPDEQLSRSTSRARDIYRIKYRTTPYFSRAGSGA